HPFGLCGDLIRERKLHTAAVRYAVKSLGLIYWIHQDQATSGLLSAVSSNVSDRPAGFAIKECAAPRISYSASQRAQLVNLCSALEKQRIGAGNATMRI